MGIKDTPDAAPHYVLRLYITGSTPHSIQALHNIRSIAEAHLAGRHNLEVIDVYQQPHLAEAEQIVALPLLVKKEPLPERKMIGDLSETEKVLRALGLLF